MNTIISENAGQRVDPLRFRKQHGNTEVVSEAVRILHLYQKATKKLPDWVAHLAAMDQKSYEQASSQETAQFKASLFKGDTMLNLTGGLGVDDVYFARSFDQVLSVDSDRHVHEMAEFNMARMGVLNVTRLHQGAEEALRALPGNFDLIYLDPDRRSTGDGKSMLLEKSSPDVLQMQEHLLQRTDHLLLKLSPLFDLTELRRILHNLEKIIVLSVRNEVKEILTVQRAEPVEDEIEISCADITAEGAIHRFSSGAPIPTTANRADDEPKYLLESGPGVVKADLVKRQGSHYGLEQIGNSPFHLSGDRIDGFLGKQYRVEWHMPVKWGAIRKQLKSEGIDRVQVTARDFHLNPTEIQKKLKIKAGEDVQLIFTRDADRSPMVYCCQRVN